MTQQRPPQRPQRPQAPQQQPQYPPQQGQYPPQQGQYPPQPQGYQQMPPAQYQQPPVQAPRQGGNPVLTALKWLAFPFVKIIGWLMSLVNLVIQEMLRSIVRFVFGIVLLVLFVAIVAAYILALSQTNFDFAGAIPVMINNILSLFGQSL